MLAATSALRAELAVAHEQQLERCQQEARRRLALPPCPAASPAALLYMQPLLCLRSYRVVRRRAVAAEASACLPVCRAQAEATDLKRFEASLKGRHHLLSTATKARTQRAVCQTLPCSLASGCSALGAAPRPCAHGLAAVWQSAGICPEADASCAPEAAVAAAAAQLGVFRARYWQQGEAGEAIETKLRGAEQHGWAQTIGQPGGAAPAGPPRPRFRATIASTEPFSAEKERASVDRAVERMLRAGGDFLKAVKSEAGPPPLSLAASEAFRTPVTNVVPERSIPRKRAGGKPQFKTAFPDSKLFDYYDQRMLLRPPEDVGPLHTLKE